MPFGWGLRRAKRQEPPILESFWITFGEWPRSVRARRLPPYPREAGVTASSLPEALDLIKRGFYRDRELPPVNSTMTTARKAPGVWLGAPAAPSGDLGIWWPAPWYPEDTVVAASLREAPAGKPALLGYAEPDFLAAARAVEPPKWPRSAVVPATGSIVEMLATAGGAPHPPANERAIVDLEARLRIALPDDLRAFLVWSDGWDEAFGEGWLVLNSVAEFIDANSDVSRLEYPGLLDVGGTGGGLSFALDYRGSGTPQAFVAFDPIDSESVQWVAPSLTEGLARLLVEPDWPWGAPAVSAGMLEEPLARGRRDTPAIAALPRQWPTINLPGIAEQDYRTYWMVDLDAMPAIDVALDGSLTWLTAEPEHVGSLTRSEDDWPEREADGAGLEIVGQAVPVPAAFRRFIEDPEPRRHIRSATACYLDLGHFAVRVRGGGTLIHFLSDQQGVLHWLLYVDPDGSEAVIATSEDLGFAYEDETTVHELDFRGWASSLAVCADSFEEFLCRYRAMNELFYLLAVDKLGLDGLPGPLRRFAEAYPRAASRRSIL